MAGYNVKVTGKSGTVYNLSDKDFADNYDKYVEGSPGAKVTMYDTDGKEQSVGIENAKAMYGEGYTYWQGQKNPHATKAKTRAEKAQAKTQASSPAATVAEKARNITNSKPQQSVAQPVSAPQPQSQPAASAPKAQAQTKTKAQQAPQPTSAPAASPNSDIMSQVENWQKSHDDIDLSTFTPASPFDKVGKPQQKSKNPTLPDMPSTRESAQKLQKTLTQSRKKGDTGKVIVNTGTGFEKQNRYYVDQQAKRRAKEFVRDVVTPLADEVEKEVIENAQWKLGDVTVENSVAPFLADVQQGALFGMGVGEVAGATTGGVVGSAPGAAVGAGAGAGLGALVGGAVGAVKGAYDIYAKQISEKTSPAAVYNALMETKQMEKYHNAVLGKITDGKGGYSKEMIEYARRAGVTPEEYAKKYVIPQIAQSVEDKYNADMDAEYRVTGLADLVARNLSQGIFGLNAYATQSASTRAKNQEAIAKAIEERKQAWKSIADDGADVESDEYHASTAGQIVAGAANVVRDAFGGGFKVGHGVQKVTEAAAGKMLQKVSPWVSRFTGSGSVMAESFVASNMRALPQYVRSVVASLPSSAGNIGGYMGFSSALATAEEQEGWTYQDYVDRVPAATRAKIEQENRRRLIEKQAKVEREGGDPSQVALDESELYGISGFDKAVAQHWDVIKSFGSGFAEGARFGYWVNLTGNAFNVASMNMRTAIGRGTVRIGGHVGEVATMVGLDYLSEGDQINWTQSLTNSVGLKVGLMTGNPAGMKRDVADLYNAAAKVRKHGWSYLFANTGGKKPHLTDYELNLVAENLGIKTEDRSRDNIVLDIAKVIDSGNSQKEAQSYKALFNPQTVPFDVRQKIAYAVFGDVQTFRPLVEKAQVVGDRIEFRAEDGELVSVKKLEAGDDVKSLMDQERHVTMQKKLVGNSLNMTREAFEQLVFDAIDSVYNFDETEESQRDKIKRNILSDIIYGDTRKFNEANIEVLHRAYLDGLRAVADATKDMEDGAGASIEIGKAEAEEANLASDQPNIDVVNDVNDVVASAASAANEARENVRKAFEKLQSVSEEKINIFNLTYDAVERLREDGMVEQADAMEEYLIASDKLTAAENTWRNAIARRKAFTDGVEQNISEAVDTHLEGVSFFGYIRPIEGEMSSWVNGDHVVQVTDKEGNVRYLRNGDIDENGKITSSSGMVTVANENGEIDFVNPEELTVIENGIQRKENVAENMKAWISERIKEEYGLSVEPAPAEAMQPGAEAMQGDAEAKQPETEAKQPQEAEINSETVKNEETDNKPAEETLVNQGEFPKDSKGKDDYLADGVTAESALARMREKGLANDEIEQMMQNRLKKSKKPTMGDDEDKFLEAKNRYNREQEIYNGVLDLLKEESKVEVAPQSVIAPADGSVPDMSVDKASDARKRGFRSVSGVRYDRQEPVDGVVGKEVEIDFTTSEKPAIGRLKVVESDLVQPSHIGRQRNPLHFISEAQPKERTDAVSDVESDKIAQNISPERITTSTNAYGGAPIINERGEVIQGNNRATALRKMSNIPESREKYKQYLMEHAEEFGMKAEDIAKMKNPVLVRELKVSDEEAIRLGQFKASDLETGGIERIDPKSTISKMSQAQIADTMRRMFDVGGEGLDDKTIGSLIDDNGVGVLKYLRQIGAITDTQYQSAFNRNGVLTEEAKNDLRKLMLQNIFEGGADNLPTAFSAMPSAAQKALAQAMAGDMRLKESDRLLPEVQKAIMAVAEIEGSGFLNGKKGYKEVKQAIEDLSKQADAFTGEPITKKYSELELELAARFLTGTQKAIKELFAQYQRDILGEKGDMFTPSEKLTKKESVKKTFDVELKEDNNNDVRGKIEEGQGDSSEDRLGGRGQSEEAERPADGEVETLTNEQIRNMSDDELLAFMQKDGNGDPNKALNMGVYDEYDSRHRDEYVDAYEGHLTKLRDNEVTLEQAQKRAEELSRDKAAFATDKRIDIFAEGDALDDYIKELKRQERISNLSTEELEQRAKFFEVAAKTDDELYDNEEYVAIINELEGRTNDLYDRVKDATDEQIISALGGDEMLDAVKDAIEKLRKGEELGQIETGLLKAVALAKKEEAAKTADKANGEKPKAEVTKLSENGTLVVGGVPKPGESNAPKPEEAPSPVKDVRREELKAEFDAAAQEAKDALLDFFTKPHGSDKASAMLIPVTEGQIKGFTRTVRAVGKLGYTAIKLGAYDFKTWCDRVLEQMGDFFREKLGWDEKNISDFLSEMWEMKFRLGDEVHTIKEWAESEKAKLAGDSAEYADRESKKDRFKSVVEKTLRESLVDESKRIKSITELRKIAKECGLENVRDTDLQEMVELAIVDIARKFEANKEISPKDRFDQVKRLYELQPSLNQRDTDRIMMQQYSTPAPMALLMGRFVNPDGKATSGLEPSAGNGMLTIGLPKEIMHVNEIDEVRLSNLQKQGFKAVTNQDGTLSFGGKKYKIVVTNPPFGSTLPKDYDGYTISGLEHQMSINALESMEDDGRAAIIIGGRTEYAQNGAIKGRDKAFLSYLYQHYDVVDVINMDGKTLYARQGTGYPTRMILINGRRTGEDALKPHFPPVFSKARAELVRDYDELYKRIEDDILRNNNNPERGRTRAVVEPSDNNNGETIKQGDTTGTEGYAGNANQKPVRLVRTGGSGQHDTPGNNRGERLGEPGDSTTVQSPEGEGTDGGGNGAIRGGSSSNGSGRMELAENGGSPDGSAGNRGNLHGGTIPKRTDGEGESLRESPSRQLGEEKISYVPRSKNPFSLQAKIPAEQADQVERRLEALGDVDAFVTEELGYSSVEDMWHGSQDASAQGGLAAEQVDSVALAIQQMKKNDAMIIGDQTGIGKGRQGAALIRWATKQGMQPIYFTKTPDLFSGVYRDLRDIGSKNLRPFILASDSKGRIIERVDGKDRVVYDLPSKREQQRVLDYLIKNGKLPPEYDYMITTYSQINNGTKDYEGGKKTDRQFGKGKTAKSVNFNGQKKRDAIESLAANSIVVMDESHEAGGESKTGSYLQYVTTKAKGITFISATFAKRPDNMPLYALRTAISKADVKLDELIDAVKRGGAAFQEVMSKALVDAGQMIRRERDMTGVTVDWKGIEDEEVISRHYKQYDNIIGLFNEIIDFQRRYVDPIVIKLNDDAADEQGEVNHTPGTKDMGINNTPFASRTHIIVRQVLLSLKAEEGAKFAVECLKKGEKPVITLENTNEGATKDAIGAFEENVEMPDLSVNLKKGLEGVLRITNKNARGDRANTTIPLEMLSDEGRQRYAEIMEHIENSSSGLSLSPIDVIRRYIKDAGYSVEELTGRGSVLDYNEDGTVKVVKRDKKLNKKRASDFNDGVVDALIVNKSACTGIDLHAGLKFANTNQRHMINVQAQANVNDEVQMRGRTDRTGQKQHSRYTYIVSTIPSEQRLLMMLKSKLRSLDANTTSSQKSKFNEMQVQDVMNKYGDEVLIQYLSEHLDTYAKLADPLKLGENFDTLSPEDFVKGAKRDGEHGGTASRILGRMALLTVKEQEAMLDDITELYTAEINRLNDMGENDLEITEMPLRAKTLDKKVWEEGAEPAGDNPFADNTYVETVEMDVLKKPMKASEVKASQERLLNDRTYEEYRNEQTEKLDKWQEEKKASLRAEYEERALRTAEKEREKYLKAALKNREKSGMTEQQCEDMADAQYKIKYDGVMEKLDTQLRNVDIQRRAFDRVLEQFDTEHVYVLPSDIYDLTQIDFGSHFGKVIGIKISNNFSTASSTVTFATLDGRRKITVPVSGMVKNKNGEKSDLFKWIDINTKHVQQGIKGPNAANTLKVLEMSNENWDKMTSSATRKKGYIITGNLLQALVSTRKQNISGKLISYTTDTGEIRQGLLMSDTFDPKSITGTKPISDAYFVIAEQRQRVTSADGDVTIDWRYGDMYSLRVPKSVKSGGKYFQDAELLDIVDDNSFYTRGGGMFADIRGEENLKRVLDILSKKLKVGVQTDNEGNINPNPEVLHRQSGYTEEQKRRWDEKENRVMFDRIKEFANKTNISDRVELHDSTEGLPEYAKSDKGWYDPQTGKIHIMVNNHESREDVMDTLLHESVAHYGLRHLFGENFNTFLDEAYRAADNGIREAIDKIAKDKGLNTRTATEEYMAELTKEINFEKPEVHSWWQRIKSEFVKMLHKLGFDKAFGNSIITDDELKYVLWRSYENMKDPKKYKSLRGKADDIAKRIELGIATEQERMVARSMEQDQTILHRKLDAKNAEDKKRIDDFEKSEKIKSYRSMQVIDGKLYPPMNAAFSGALVEGLKPGDYDMAEEHPELAKPKKMRDGSTQYYFDLDKATKDATGKKATAVKGVLYDPYLHSKNNMLNDQFKSAWIRPNVVTVELEIAKDDLNSGYRAEKAGLSVGEHEWKPGTVAKELIKEGRHDGKLYLTQMAKIVRVVPDAEVAENIAKMVEGTDIEIPENVVQPKLRGELEKLGVKIGAPEKGVNKTEQIEQALQAGLEVQNTIRLRGGNNEDVRTQSKVAEHTPQHIASMRSAVQSAIDGLGGKGKVVTSEAELDATGRRALKKDSNMKGYYDIATGDVVVYLPNCESGYDAVKTVMHEKVGHEGLRQALGEEGYRQFYTKLWMSLSEAERKAISEKASRRKWDFFGEAMDETLAEKAEDFTDEGHSFIESVKNALTYVAAKLGINRSLTPRDVRIALWLSKNRLTGNENNLQYKLAKAAFEAKVRRYAPKEPTNFDGFKFTKEDAKAIERATNGEYIPSCLDGVYDSDGNIRTKVMSEEEREALDRSLTPAGRYARAKYEDGLKRTAYLWTEGHQNNLASLDIAQNSIAGGREKVKDGENALWELNHLGGKDRTEQDAYEREYIIPLRRQISRMLPNLDGKDSHEKFVALEHYVTAKSGLERNRAFAVRDYRDKLLRKAGRTQAKANSLLKQADALQAEVDALMDADPENASNKKVEEEKVRAQAEKALKEATSLREKAENFLAEYDKKRNSLVTDLTAGKITLRDFYEELDSFIGETIDKFDVSKADRSGLSDSNVFPEWAGEDKGAYDDNAVIEHVMEMESRLGKWAVEDLWSMIDKMAKFAVEKSYVSGEITKEAKDRANTMFTWYVPLRGFDADTAEDMWNYLDLDKSGVGRTLMGAKGRTSASDSPLNTLMLLGDSAILRGNRNVAKQALVRLVRNNPNDLISEYETWYKVGEDAEGNTVLTPSYPELTEEMTPKQIADAIREHEENIKEEMEEGIAVYRKLKDSPKNMPYRVLRPKQMAQHFINVNINGKPVTLVVHSHPRVAQAVNGMLVNNTRGLGAVKWLNSQISQLATSKSATFIARNAMRDYEFASLSIASTESAAYLGNFQKMYWQLWGKALGNAVPGTAIEVGNMAREAVNKVKNGEAAEPAENKSGVVNSMRILFKKQRAGELNTRKKPNGEYENEVEGYFDEFVKGGGVTGYVQLAGLDTMKEKTLDTLDSYFSNSTADKVKKMSAKTIGKVFKTYFDAIEAVNEAVENQTRFSAYYASRKAGRTRLRATQDAKNVSVNFNKTGSGSAVLSMKFGDSSTWYKANRRLAGSTAWFFKNSMIFYNAGVQGMSRTAQMWLNGGKGTKAKLAGMIGAVPFMLGASLPYLNGLSASALDDDDDRKKYGENPYLQLPDYERRHNICLYMGKGRWFKIPVFIEGSTFFGLGDIAAGYSFYPELLGNKNVGVQVAEAVTQVSPVDAFGGSKVGANNVGGAMLGAVTPSLMQPTIAMWTNVGWTGSPISRSNEWNENDPNWTKGSEKTQSVYVDIAHMLNSATGGKDAADGTGVTKGAIDLDPAKMQYLVEQYFSSPGKEIVSYADILSSMVEEDKDVDWGRAPVLKAVYRDNTPYNVRNNDITRWYSYVEDSKKTEHDIREFRKHGSIVDARAIMDSKEGRQLRVIKTYAPIIKKLKTAKNMATRRADANLIQEKIAALTAEAMDRIDEIEKADKEK